MSNTNRNIADLFSTTPHFTAADGGKGRKSERVESSHPVTFSYLFFSDVRKDISDQDKYHFARDLVEFADTAGFEAVYFPERHFYEFGSIYANNAVVAAYFAPLTKNIRLRTAAVTATLHHPVEIVENWAMVDILSNGRVDLGFGNGWNKADFVTSPGTWADRASLRNKRIPIVQKLWRGEPVNFPGPDGEMFSTTVYPRPIQKELNVWYVTISIEGFRHAGANGYNVFTMLYGIDLKELGKKIDAYREARKLAGLNAESGIVSLMLHTFVHPDIDWVHQQVEKPFKQYIRSSLLPQMKAAGQSLNSDEVDKLVDYSYTRYFQSGGIFGSIDNCQNQVRKAIEVGVNDIALLQDFGVDYDAVRKSLSQVQNLVEMFKSSSKE